MQPEFREAQESDTDLLLQLMREFTETQAYPFDAKAVGGALRELLGSPSLGRVWLVEVADSAVGYVVLAFGFSLEYGGRDAFVDELFVRPPYRRRGIGRAALSFALERASRLGVRAVHLEVGRTNDPAQQLYRSLGFEGHDRHLLTRRLHAVS